MELRYLAAIAGMLVLLESALIMAGLLAPVSSYSIGNILFLLARVLVIFYAGWSVAKSGLRVAAKNGAIVAAVAALVLFLSVFAGRLLGRPILGMGIPSDALSLLLIVIINLAINVLIGTVIAVIGAFLRRSSTKS